METNDKILNDFFNQHKKEIDDNGFSERVVRKLPEQQDKSWIVWAFAAIGTAISIYLGISLGLIEHVFRVLVHIPIYYFLICIFTFPLVGTAGYYLAQDKRISL